MFIGCPLEQDATWNITWPETNIDAVAQQKCPGGSEAEGRVQLYASSYMVLEHLILTSYLCNSLHIACKETRQTIHSYFCNRFCY